MAADPVTAVSNAVSSVFEFATAGLEIYQARVTAERDEREQERAVAADAREREADRQNARNLYVQIRRDQNAADALAHLRSMEREQRQHLYENYPVTSGPGTLRADIQLLYPDPMTMPPLVLFVPSHQDGDPGWRLFWLRLQAALRPLQLDESAVVRWTDRFTAWPNAALIARDLADLPTLLISADVVAGELELKLGGCNLGGKQWVRNLTQVVRTQLPSGDYWTPERLDWFESTSKSGFHRTVDPAGTVDEHLVQLEWATRLGCVAIVAAVDAYHLMRRSGYAEKLDDALDLVEQSMADRLSIPYPDGALADPFHHELHQVRRLQQRGSKAAARRQLVAAFERLGDCPGAGLAESIHSTRSTDRIRPWHSAVLEELRMLLPPDALAALDRPSETLVPTAPISSDPMGTAIASDRAPAAVVTKYVSRPIRETAKPMDEDTTRVYESRPIKQTRGDEPDQGT